MVSFSSHMARNIEAVQSVSLVILPSLSMCGCVCAQDAWGLQDEWMLVGHGLDFVDDEAARAHTPDVTVVPRPAGIGGKKDDAEENKETLANTVFVAADSRRRRSSSQHSASGAPYNPSGTHKSCRGAAR